MYVEQMKGRTGNPVNNQFVVSVDKPNMVRFFQSYRSVCAIVEAKEGRWVLTLTDDWNRSTTTRKYFWKFIKDYTPYPINEYSLEEIRAAIKAGKIKVIPTKEANYL